MNQQNSKYVYIQNQNSIPSFKLLIPKSLKLLGSTVRRIRDSNNYESVPQLEIT